jgi:hypothetical protein
MAQSEDKNKATAGEGDSENSGPKFIVFCDTQNKEYAERLIETFRRITGWQVLKDTPIWANLRKFSLGYSRKKRDTYEVAHIFIMASQIEY